MATTQRPPPARRPPAHAATQGSMQNLRESSRSPSIRSRTIKTHSMPIVPSAMQIFAASNAAQPSAQQQPSPTSSIHSRRSPPAAVSVQRLLPTPPHPPSNNQDASPDPHGSPPLIAQHSHSQPNPHYPRPMHRNAPPQFIAKYQNLEQENWEVTEELLADIERADLQQSQAQANPSNTYTTAYLQNQQASSPPKDPAVERVRAMERSSPKEPDINQQRRQQAAARESPKARERQPTSPTAASFAQAASHSPERRASPFQSGLVSSEHPTGYMQYTREPPPTIRRTSNAPPAENRQAVPSLATQTPPLQSIPTRTPDRSLPVQEELEDEPAKNGAGTRQTWQEINDVQHVRHTGASPTPSSDLNPEGTYADNHRDGRSSRAGHREESGPALQQQDNSNQQRYPDQEHESAEDENSSGYTPRSPTADLPEHPPSKYYSPPLATARPPQQQVPRRHTRNGSTDQLGLPSFDTSVFEGDTTILTMGSEVPHQYMEPRRQSHASPPQPEHYHNSPQYSHPSQQQYREPKGHPDEMQHYDSSYIQSYLQSPRPEAPVPPTPHSQTAAPSPSPLLSGNYEGGAKELPPFSPVAPVGSPFPYPFNHMRRNQTFSGHPNRPQVPASFNANDIQQQLARQWEVYAQNHQNHQYGAMSESTFSPSATPFENTAFAPWAYLHTNRTLGRLQDTTSMRSSPSHEPVELPVPPPTIGVKKSQRPMVLRRRQSGRKPPPRVDSTQPRETSPEPSSSGEETAGEERIGAPEDGNWSGGTIAPPIAVVDDNDEWVDEEDDDDDLLELEYHQNYVNNVEKRRRRWEVGWEALTQALQTLDRQTDATIVVMAAPSHSTKLYSATSRSVRRQASAATSAVTMKEMRTAFGRLATQRRISRSHKSSLVDRFLTSSASSGNGSDGSSESRESDLKRALGAALGSLASLGGIYDQREARWRDEMRRISEDRERVELLLRQALGEHHSGLRNGLGSHAPSLS